MYSLASSSGEAALVAMAVGTVLIVMCAISIALAIRRRRRQNLTKTPRRLTILTGKGHSDSRFAFQPTDFMNNLASWDRCHPIDEEALEKRRRAVWTLELFENHGLQDAATHKKQALATPLHDC